jgi:putative ABC transport system ATP-binding protein
VVELLLGLNRERGTTLVVVTHDAELASRATRVVHLAGGRVARIEEPARDASGPPRRCE